MYFIKHNQEGNYLEIEDVFKTSYAKIYLNDGGSLRELTLKGTSIMIDLNPLDYASTYESSILFPFVNRIKDGQYSFNGKSYQLDINQKEENNALHGLVYNKKFQLKNQKLTDTEAYIILEYIETKESQGFPFTYNIQLEYILSENSLSLRVSIKNTSNSAFPFTIGWHPYFVCDDLHESSLIFDSNKKLVNADRNIAIGTKEITLENKFEIKDKELNDCWVLNGNDIQFMTPNYLLTLHSSAKNNFLQVYTPPKANTIAIEPTTGVSDSFNNKIGLQILNPNETYEVEWTLKIN